jgi:membrane fusion protein
MSNLPQTESPAPPPRKLFREEALAHHQEKFWGEVMLARPLSLTWLTLGALAIACAIGSYLAWGEYTRKVKVSGYLSPQVGVVRVAASQAGVLSFLAEEGVLINAGEPIAKLTLERDPGSAARQAALKTEIERRRDSLTAERSRADTSLEEQRRALDARERSLKQEIEASTREIAVQQERITALSNVADRFDKLLKEGFVGPNVAEQRKSDMLEQRARLEAMQRTRVQIQRDADSVQSERRNIAIKRDSQQGELDRQLSGLNREQVDTDDQAREIVITAPISGIVATRAATQGQSVSAGASLVSMLPKDDPLRAELLVPTRAAGFVKPGQTVALRYQAFPFERFGHAVGTVKDVGSNVLAVGESGPLAPKEPVYRVVVTLPEQSVLAYGQAMNLRAGMLLDADIQLERRKLYEWLIEPILAAVRRA